MSRKFRIVKVPQSGYIVIGQGTYSLGHILEGSNVDPDEINQLLQEQYIEEVPAAS